MINDFKVIFIYKNIHYFTLDVFYKLIYSFISMRFVGNFEYILYGYLLFYIKLWLFKFCNVLNIICLNIAKRES